MKTYEIYQMSLSQLQRYLNTLKNGYVDKSNKKQIFKKENPVNFDNSYFPQSAMELAKSGCGLSFDIANLIKEYFVHHGYYSETYVLMYQLGAFNTDYLFGIAIANVNNKWIAFNNIVNPKHFFLIEYESKRELLKNIYKDFQEKVKKLMPNIISYLDFYFDSYDYSLVNKDSSWLKQIVNLEHEHISRDEYSSMSIVICNNKVLTLLTVDNKYGLPKGHIEKGETSKQTAIRECQEETGVILKEEDWLAEIKGFDYSFKGANCKYYTNSEFFDIFGVGMVHKSINVHVFKIDEERPIIITEPENFKNAFWMTISDFDIYNSYDNQKHIISEALLICDKDIMIVKPTKEYEDSVKSYVLRTLESSPTVCGGSSVEKAVSYDDWLNKLKIMENPNTTPIGLVPATSYLLVIKSNKQVIGMASFRHCLNDYLLRFAGHIGYSIHPDYRNQGYAKLFLKLLLVKARNNHLDKVLITCNKENLASAHVVLASGGVEDFTIENEMRRFWITL